MLETINNKIQRRFSESAKGYDLYSRLHREIGDNLLSRVIKEPQVNALLDVGCGTGYLTVKAKEHFPQSKIVGLDIAPGMLKIARSRHEDIAWVLADGNNLPFSDGSFKILISNLAYHWAGDLAQAFREARRVLVPDGLLAGTLFGYHTCQELFQSLDEVQRGALQFTRLPDDRQVREALSFSGFEKYDMACEQIKIEFKDMHGLIAWLKSIGANNLLRAGYVGRNSLLRAAAIYQERFASHNGIYATFEVIEVYAKA